MLIVLSMISIIIKINVIMHAYYLLTSMCLVKYVLIVFGQKRANCDIMKNESFFPLLTLHGLLAAKSNQYIRLPKRGEIS